MRYLIIVVLILSGCASQIMKSYIGKDVREVAVDYGSPSNAFDMGDGRRAFQWVSTKTNVSPSYATTNANVNYNGYNSAWINSNTTISGGSISTSQCIYTLFAKWNVIAEGWYVVDFREPKLRCSIID